MAPSLSRLFVLHLICVAAVHAAPSEPSREAGPTAASASASVDAPPPPRPRRRAPRKSPARPHPAPSAEAHPLPPPPASSTQPDAQSAGTQLPAIAPQSPVASPAAPAPAASSAPATPGPAAPATTTGATPAGEGDPLAGAKVATEPVLHLTFGGGATLWYYQPFGVDGLTNNVEVYDSRLSADATWGAFGFYLEPHFRDTRLRPYYDGPVWLELAYAYWTPGPVVVKVGKVFSRFGLFWDGSFYGNIQVYDGLKLAPEYGVSAEGSLGDALGVRYVAQFLPLDGRTNISLAGRDTVSVPGARRRNEVVARLEPYMHIGGGELTGGLSGEYFRADFPVDADDVLRGAVDAKLTYGGLGVWAEAARQSGRSVTDAVAIGGRASANDTYVLAGAEYTVRRLTVRYNVSFASYDDVSIQEWLHVPGVGYAFVDHLSGLLELAVWQRRGLGGVTLVDRSVDVTLSAAF